MRRWMVLAIAGLSGVCAQAQENNDLDRIPQAIEQAPAEPSEPAAHGKYFLEDAIGWFSYRGSFAVPYPYGAPSRWSDRASFDVLDQWSLAPDLTVTFSDRLSATVADGVVFPKGAVRNDPREAYLTWEVAPQTYLEAGRINLRYGVAFGYNPTDYFRARTTVAQSSADPGAQRLNRLGTVMVRAQRIFDGGALEVVYAPKLHKPIPIGTLPDPLDPKIDQTNGTDRILAAVSFDLEELNPQILLYHDSGRTQFGLNLSHPIGSSVIAYASWSGGVMPNMIADAITFGKKSGTLPAVVPLLPPTTAHRSFQSDLSAGAYWTGEDRETISLEYNFHQAGFTGRDWHNWFTIGADPSLSSLMWYLRGWASDQQQPMARHQLFVRADWVEPFIIEHLDINAFVMTDLHDGSSLGQLAASYDLSDNWSIAAYFGGSIGGRRTEWGSLGNAATATVQIQRYL